MSPKKALRKRKGGEREREEGVGGKGREGEGTGERKKRERTRKLIFTELTMYGKMLDSYYLPKLLKTNESIF